MTASIVSTRILKTTRALARGEKISKVDTRRLAQAGISPEMATRIADQAKHWEEFGAVTHAATVNWTDRGAVQAFRNALLRDVDNTIITPGAGDAPLWTSSEWGKTVFQFKRFAMASTQRTLISGLQNRDAGSMLGIMTMVGLGALGVALRDYISNGEIRERNTRAWVADSIDRSGTTGLFFEMDALMEKSTGHSPVTALTGQEVSRFAGRGILPQLAGPTAGLVEDLGRATFGAVNRDFTQPDLHRVRRLVPGQNIFWARWAFDEMEKGLAKAFDLPAQQSRRR